MASLKYKTRGNSSPQGKPRVYFCCHPEDSNRYFESISDEILAKQNCAVWYSDEEVVRDEDFFADLKQMQLFVMPVTTNLLCTENEALDTEFKFAIENHIPVLPMMQEGGLEEIFNKKCGDLQFLDKNNTDVTAISYDEKLKKYLESVLIGDELAEKIRAAFDAYVFLSYRKKDRRYAQELMRLIHKNEFCRDIAIWYDEFLTLGENFNDSIKEALQKSGLFVLTVTPNLINEPNYIMTTEYPMAKQEGKPILPAELVPTDLEQLSEKYEDIPVPADAHNEIELSKALLESIKKMAIKENDNSPEHNFFIGLAYLGGIDVEVDTKRAVSLIISAAETGLMQAIDKLVVMYRNGEGVERDYNKAIYWQKQKIEKLTCDLQQYPKQSGYMILFSEVVLLGDFYKEITDYSQAEKNYENAYKLVDEFETNSADKRLQAKICSCDVRRKLGDLLMVQQKTLSKAKWLYKHYLWGYQEILEETKDDKYTENVTLAYMRLGDAFYMANDHQNAQKCYERCHQLSVSLCHKTGDDITIETGSFFARKLIWESYIKIGNIQIEKCNYGQAESYYMRAWSFAIDIERENGSPETMTAVVECNRKLSDIKLLKNDTFMACAFSWKALDYAEKVLSDTDTYVAKMQLAECYCRYAFCLLKEKRVEPAKVFLKKADLLTRELMINNESPQIRLLISNIYECWGEIYIVEDDQDQALLNFKKSKEICEALALKECLPHICEALAKSYYNMGRLSGKMYVYLALDVYDELLYRRVSKRQYMDMVKIINEFFNECREAVQEIDVKDDENDYFHKIQQVYVKIADVYIEKGDMGIAKSFLLRAIKIKESENSRDSTSKKELAALYQRVAMIYDQEGDLMNSQKYRSKSLEIALFIFD